MTDLLRRLSIPAPDRITLDDIIAMYEALRPFAPAAGAPPPEPREVTRLVDVLAHVDALVLDGFGVINVGASKVDGIIEFFEAAAAQKVPVMVLTNGAGQGAGATWTKYRDWGLPIERHQVVSSRDALEAALAATVGTRRVAPLGPMARPFGIAGELTLAADQDLFERADCFAFLASAG